MVSLGVEVKDLVDVLEGVRGQLLVGGDLEVK